MRRTVVPRIEDPAKWGLAVRGTELQDPRNRVLKREG